MKKSMNHRLYAMIVVTAMLIWTAGAAQALITEYTDEAAYLAALANLGYNTLQEGFENSATWGSARQPTTALSVVSQGIVWQTNHPDPPASNGITTGMGPARTGLWGVYDPDHGYATGFPVQCDVDTPPANCFFHDGFTGTREAGADTLYGVGGWVNGIFGGKIILILDGNESNPIDFGDLGGITATHKFFGVIDTDGFTQFEFREIEGKVGDQKFIFGDDFTFGKGVLVFEDVPPGYWAEDYIYAIFNAGITKGCSQNPLKYCPQADVTRAQMAAFIVRAEEGEPPANYCDSGSPFSDVPTNYWACKYIKRLSELGITTGCGGGNYCPIDTVTRAQMAAFLVRAVEGEPAANYCDTGSPFTDVPTNYWACKYIKRLSELGITTGCGGGNYCPNDTVTRAQMAAFLARAFLGME